MKVSPEKMSKILELFAYFGLKEDVLDSVLANYGIDLCSNLDLDAQEKFCIKSTSFYQKVKNSYFSGLRRKINEQRFLRGGIPFEVLKALSFNEQKMPTKLPLQRSCSEESNNFSEAEQDTTKCILKV